jgi:hypothetical protein
MAFEAHRDRIINVITSVAFFRNDVVRLDLDPTKSMADAAAPVASNKQC